MSRPRTTCSSADRGSSFIPAGVCIKLSGLLPHPRFSLPPPRHLIRPPLHTRSARQPSHACCGRLLTPVLLKGGGSPVSPEEPEALPDPALPTCPQDLPLPAGCSGPLHPSLRDNLAPEALHPPGEVPGPPSPMLRSRTPKLHSRQGVRLRTPPWSEPWDPPPQPAHWA